MGIETIERQADHRDTLPRLRHTGRGISSGQYLHGSLDRCPECTTRKLRLECELASPRTQPVSGLHDFVFHIQDMRERGVAFLQRYRRRKPRLFFELRGIHERDGACAVRERSHFCAADHHGIGSKSCRHGLRAKCARKPAFVQILIRTRAGIPDLDGSKMREIRLRVTDALHDRELPVFPERHQWLHGGMKTRTLVELDDLFALDADARAQCGVSRSANGMTVFKPSLPPFSST